MCQHRIEIIRTDHGLWETVFQSESSKQRGGPPDRFKAQAEASARQALQDLRLLYPEQEFRVDWFSCQGPEESLALPGQAEPQSLTRERLQLASLRHALRFYAQADNWRSRTREQEDGSLLISSPTLRDQGGLARQTLQGGENGEA